MGEQQVQQPKSSELLITEGRFFDTPRRAIEVATAVGFGAMVAWATNYAVDIPYALAIGGGATGVLGTAFLAFESWIESGYKANMQRNADVLFSQTPDKYVAQPASADDTFGAYQRGERKKPVK